MSHHRDLAIGELSNLCHGVEIGNPTRTNRSLFSEALRALAEGDFHMDSSIAVAARRNFLHAAATLTVLVADMDKQLDAQTSYHDIRTRHYSPKE